MSQQRDRLIAEALLRITDRCREALAAAALEGVSADCLGEQIADINRLVWDLRWEVGPSGGKTELDRDHGAEGAVPS